MFSFLLSIEDNFKNNFCVDSWKFLVQLLITYENLPKPRDTFISTFIKIYNQINCVAFMFACLRIPKIDI